MSEQNIDNEIKELIAGIVQKDPSEITPEVRFVEDLGVDSMMALEILSAVERKFRILIPEDKLPQMRTLNATIQIAKEYLAQKAPEAAA